MCYDIYSSEYIFVYSSVCVWVCVCVCVRACVRACVCVCGECTAVLIPVSFFE
jgi:hypothetical protein